MSASRHGTHDPDWSGRARRTTATTVTMALAIAACAVVGALAPTGRVLAAAVFDYSMPDRYGMDDDGDGVIDSYVPTTTCVDEDGPCTDHLATSAFAVEEDSWHVDFDACGSTGATEFDWLVLWRPVVAVQQTPGGGCADFFAEFPDEGTYRVGLRTRSDPASEWSEWAWQEVVVQDWLIVSMGDSYGSGEGSPDVPIDLTVLDDAAAAFGDLADALAELADFGPCNAGTGFDFDTCVDVLEASGSTAIDEAASLIRQLDDPVCDILDPAFDLLACGNLLIALGLEAVEATIEGVGAAVTNTYNTYVTRFQDVYDAALASVEGIEAVIEEFRRGARWQDRRCHRSANAGASLAAMELERLDPRTSVTLVHVACTGAMILQGVLDSYAGAEDELESTAAPTIPPQVHQAAELIGDREIDVVNLSIGGNDVNFGPMIMSCMLRTDCTQPGDVDDIRQLAETAAATNCGQQFPGVSFVYQPITSTLCGEFYSALADSPFVEKDARTLFDLGRFGDPSDPLRPGIAVAYQMLSDALHRTPFSGPGLPGAPDQLGLGLPTDRNDRVYITEYVNPLRRDDGEICSFDTDGLEMLPGASAAETAFLDAEIVAELSEVVSDGAATHGWNFVDGVVDGFVTRFGEGHGYCAAPDGFNVPTAFADPAGGSWMVQLQDAFVRQGNKMGAVHPNTSGFRHYAQQILPSWLADLYGDPVGLLSPRRPDQAPFADAGPTRLLDEGATRVLTNDSYDGDGDPLTYAWSTTSPAFSVAPSASAAPTLTAIDDGAGYVQLTVDDGDEGTSSDEAIVVVRNVAPSVTGGSGTVEEGAPLLASVTFTDPGVLDTHTATVDYDDGATTGPTPVTGGTVPLSHTYVDQGTFTAAVTVTDDDDGSGVGTFDVTVVNAPPVVGPITAPIEPVLIGTTVAVSAGFTDAGVLDTHSATVDWGDGTTTPANVTQAAGSGSVAASHPYGAPGIYTVTVSVDDGDGGVETSEFLYIVVYDPEGGFATGGGIIHSPAGAYVPEPDAAGPAVFAFVSKYKKGATTPEGHTSFRFHAADFVFASTSYDWLVISNSKATYKGVGTVNGGGDYGFLLSAVDGDADTASGPDRLRLKVWDLTSGEIVYDNQAGAADDTPAATAITGGAITANVPRGR
jgi:hypothetical protein